MALAVLIVLAALASGASPALAATKDVSVGDDLFGPANVAVMPGDTVRWTHAEGGDEHNVHFEDSPLPLLDLSRGAWTAQRTFSARGMYRYYCDHHGGPGGQGMSGIVYVNDLGNVPPTASLVASPSTAEVNANVVFSATGTSDPDGTITKYEWDLDDGVPGYDFASSTPSTTRSYATAGRRNVRLRVTDNLGATTESAVRTVVVTDPPTASFMVSPNPAASGQTVTFDASASADPDGSIASYDWDLDGNGLYETFEFVPTTTRAYSGPATVTVGLRVTDNAGLSATTTRSLQVQAPVVVTPPPPPPPPPPAVTPPPVAVAASTNCSTLTGASRATCMQKACKPLTGTKKATCINKSCRYLTGSKRASCVQTSCRYVAKSKRASCNRASCRYLTGSKRRACQRKYARKS